MKSVNQMLKKKRLSWSFVIIVLVPSITSGVYFGFVASDRYVSVSNFVVRSPQKTTSVSGVFAFLQSAGLSRSQDDSYVVNEYVLSRDAMEHLNNKYDLRKIYSSLSIDLFSRFDPLKFNNSNEMLYKYYKNKVYVQLDNVSSISTLEVRAYTPQDAYKLNSQLLIMAESLVNQMNQRARKDILENSIAAVNKAKENVANLSSQLVQYRQKHNIFDIDKQSSIDLQLVSKLQDQLILVNTQLDQIRLITPDNPQIEILNERKASIQKEIDKIQQQMLGESHSSLNQKSSEYERIVVEKDVATKQLAAALATLEQNSNDLESKQLYLERISQPNLPDMAEEPYRLKNISFTVLFSLIIWGIYQLIYAGVREHQE
ncbi:hypothetical protein [Acinetobacter sp.]|uniref:hypothetical protein n=1 Tax=Acinetobacter sp. TaxID=472 RepID=UPI0031D5C71B